MRYDCVIWDWNGTLLDDVSVSVRAMNMLLEEYGLPAIPNEEYYRGVFGFPVRDYYERLGFNFAAYPYEVPAVKFIENYGRICGDAGLRPDAKATLEALKAAGIRQVLLSASEKQSLERQVAAFGISGYFSDILGIGDCYAAGKTDLAREFFANHPKLHESAVFVGDTLHDAETARAVGCVCIAVAGGHASPSALKQGGAEVFPSLSAAAEAITVDS